MQLGSGVSPLCGLWLVVLIVGAVLTMPVDVAIETEQGGCPLGEAWLHPSLGRPAIPGTQAAGVARVPILGAAA